MTELQKDHRRLLDNLKMLQKIHGAAVLAEVLGISGNTWTNRMKEPWKKFCYDDFRLLSTYCHISIDVLISGRITIG